MNPVRWKRIGDHYLPTPKRATAGSAGYDLAWTGSPLLTSTWTLYRGEKKLFDTGWACAIPDGYAGLVCTRSGFAKRGGRACLDPEIRAGLIDSDYRGEIKLMLFNESADSVEIHAGVPVAQIVIVPCYMADSIEVADLEETARGAGGFGSTG